MSDPAPDAPPPIPRRRRWTLSLRALMLVVLVVGGYLGWRARRISIQRRAVATISAAGGRVWYDYQVKPNATGTPPSPPAPGWLRRLVGDEPFQEVAKVSLGQVWNPIDDAAIDAFLALDLTESLNLNQAWLKDRQAGRIAGAARLKALTLGNAVVGHDGFREICRRAGLESLDFEIHRLGTTHSYYSRWAAGPQQERTFRGEDRITPETVGAIRSLAHLKGLRITDTTWGNPRPPGEENYLPHVAALRQLESIRIWDRCFTDDDLRRFAQFDRLETLEINGTLVSDDGLAVAAGWPRLKALSFWPQNYERHCHAPRSGSDPDRLTDAGVAHLARSRRLEELSLVGLRFTDAGMALLVGLPALRTLKLDGFDGTAATLGPLLAKHRFERLTLMGPGVGDWVAPLLVGQRALKELALIGPALTDAMVPSLTRLPALGALRLNGSALSDAGLARLAATPAPIYYLDLRGSRATQAGAVAFRATHPGTAVLTGPDDSGY